MFLTEYAGRFLFHFIARVILFIMKHFIFKTADLGAGIVATAGNYLLSSNRLLMQSIWAPAGAFTAFVLNAIVLEQSISEYRKSLKLSYENIAPYVKWPRRLLFSFLLIGAVLNSMYAGAYGKDLERHGADQPTPVSSYNNIVGILAVAVPHLMRFCLQSYYERVTQRLIEKFLEKKFNIVSSLIGLSGDIGGDGRQQLTRMLDNLHLFGGKTRKCTLRQLDVSSWELNG